MKALLLSLMLLLTASCGSEVVRRAKLSAADAVGKHSQAYLKTQALKELGDLDYKALNCADEAVVLSEKLRDGVDSVLKTERQQEASIQKSIGGDIIGLSCNFLLKQVVSATVAGRFDDYACAQKLFGRGLEKASDKLCPYIKSKLE
ncbi:MAG: hypothetical protein Unbinned1322contig1000_47 [Prokaryotic dsDNA virus sp.]|nr:MAG: hypothetical protein Unbinned1322contig1000_47 [Prokaryotic dsDNA virus sp.]|tara:strand:- start:26613 stop:27053 length:441 start_codon:yes stop_codon:yes gene_type:complete